MCAGRLASGRAAISAVLADPDAPLSAWLVTLSGPPMTKRPASQSEAGLHPCETFAVSESRARLARREGAQPPASAVVDEPVAGGVAGAGVVASGPANQRSTSAEMSRGS